MNTSQINKQGRFIVFEGVEGVGKSTQVKLLAQWLESQGHNVITTREPGGTPLAESIRELVLTPRDEDMYSETELLLMMAARLQHWNGHIKPALERGDWVICDRFIDSSVAYQGAGRGMSEDFIRQIHHDIAPEMKPDLVLVLDLSLEDGWARVKSRGEALDRMEQASADFFVRARQCFKTAATLAPERYAMIDGAHSMDEVALAVQAQIQQRLQQNS